MPHHNQMKHHQWDTSIDPLIVPAFLHLHWSQLRTLDIMKPLLARFELSLVEFDVLVTLRNAPAPHQLTPSEIQAEVVITSGGLTKVMTQLETRGLVLRHQLQRDLRIKPLGLTAAGKARAETAMLQVVAATRQWLRAALSESEIEQLTALLSKLSVTLPPN